MAETTDGTTGGSGGTFDKVLSFLKEPLGMGLVAGAAIALFLAWRVF